MKKFFLAACLFFTVAVYCAAVEVSPVLQKSEKWRNIDVKECVLRGCYSAGWEPVEKEFDKVSAMIIVRNKHLVFVDIKILDDGWEILYRDSNNMGYRPQRYYRNRTLPAVIHDNYAVWVGRLNENIKRAALNAPAKRKNSRVLKKTDAQTPDSQQTQRQLSQNSQDEQDVKKPEKPKRKNLLRPGKSSAQEPAATNKNEEL